MTEIKVTVSGARISAQVTGPLTSGMVGVPVSFVFNEDWHGFSKTAVFRAGERVIDRLEIQDVTNVPWEVLQAENCILQVGVYGTSKDGKTVIPTIWVDVDRILPGADPGGDVGADHSLPVWQQLICRQNRLEETAVTALEKTKGAAIQATNAAEKADASAAEAAKDAAEAQKVVAAYEAGKLTGAQGPQGPQGQQGPQGPQGEPGAALIDDTSFRQDAAWSSWNAAEKCCPAFEESGAIVTCEPVEGYPLDVVTRIEPVQAGSGIPSPNNVRPITGWTGAKLWRGGKNMLPFPYTHEDADTKEWSDNGVTRTINDDGSITMKGTATALTYKPRLTTLQKGLTGVVWNQNTYYDGGNGIMHVLLPKGTTVDTTIYPQLEYGSVATEYEPYRGEFFQVDFGQAVYGGSFNWKTGVLTVDAVCGVIARNTIRVGDGDTYYYSITGDSGLPKPTGNGDPRYRRFCNCFEPEYTVANYPEFDGKIAIFDNTIIRFKFDSTWTQEQVDAWLDANEIVICYPIEPVTVQLTPREVLALSGKNTLYSDTGDTTVTGRADPTAVIEKLTNAIIALGGNV